MPRLTGKELSELYPKAKSFDQLRTEGARIQELRRPRLVALRIAICTTLCTVVVLAAYRLALHAVPTSQSDNPETALIGVGQIGLIAAVALAAVWYLRSLIDTLASKTIAAPGILYTALIAALLLAGAGYWVLCSYLHADTLAVTTLFGSTFILSLLAVLSILKNQ